DLAGGGGHRDPAGLRAAVLHARIADVGGAAGGDGDVLADLHLRAAEIDVALRSLDAEVPLDARLDLRDVLLVALAERDRSVDAVDGDGQRAVGAWAQPDDVVAADEAADGSVG